jgi:hypothetical protein
MNTDFRVTLAILRDIALIVFVIVYCVHTL